MSPKSLGLLLRDLGYCFQLHLEQKKRYSYDATKLVVSKCDKRLLNAVSYALRELKYDLAKIDFFREGLEITFLLLIS
jgi:hypothetical protein